MLLFVYLYSNDASKYVGSVHHQINDKLSAAALLNWTSGSKDPSSLTVCGKYVVDQETFIKVFSLYL